MTKRRYPTALLAILLWSVLSSSLFFVSTVLAADNSSSSSYYDVLEVDPKADAKSIKKQYRKLALRWHPDKHQSDADKEEATKQFTLINEAFETLGDDERRKEYDASLRQERQQRGSASARGSGSGSGQRSQQAPYDSDAYQQQQYQYGQQQQYQYGYDGRGGPESYYYYDQYQEPMYEQQANAYTTYSYRGPHRDPYEQFNSFFSRKFGYDDDDDDAYYDEYDAFFGSGRRSQQRYQRHQRPRAPQSLDDWLDLAAIKAQQALRAAEQAVDRGIDWVGHAIADLARDLFEPDDADVDDSRDGYHSWNSRRWTRRTSQNNNDKWNKQKQKAKQWWGKAKKISRQWSQKIRRSKHTRKLTGTAKKVKSRVSRWIRHVDQSIDRQKLEMWIKRTQQKASHISQKIGRVINGILLGEDDDGSEENYSSKSSRTYYQNGVETTVQTFFDVRGNRIEEVYLNGMLAERYVNGVPDVIY